MPGTGEKTERSETFAPNHEASDKHLQKMCQEAADHLMSGLAQNLHMDRALNSLQNAALEKSGVLPSVQIEASKYADKDLRPKNRDDAYVKANFPLLSDNTSTTVADAVKKQGKVYTDVNWSKSHQGDAGVTNFVYFEEGNQQNPMKGSPIRSGTEIELYDKICKYARAHDIRDPKQKITPDMVMDWSLEVNRKADGSVVIQDALLTGHNVMRALARADVADASNLPAGDPVRYIIEDSQNQHLPGRMPGLPQLMRAKYEIKGVNAETNQDLFDKNNPYSVFKPMTDDRNSSAGSAYHFWVGAFTASTLSAPVAKALVFGEGSLVKGGNKTGTDEQPWGNAGIKAYEQMNKNLHWSWNL